MWGGRTATGIGARERGPCACERRFSCEYGYSTVQVDLASLETYHRMKQLHLSNRGEDLRLVSRRVLPGEPARLRRERPQRDASAGRNSARTRPRRERFDPARKNVGDHRIQALWEEAEVAELVQHQRREHLGVGRNAVPTVARHGGPIGASVLATGARRADVALVQNRAVVDDNDGRRRGVQRRQRFGQVCLDRRKHICNDPGRVG